MTVLTWRDVATPDFRGSMDGLEVASKSFNSAFAGIKGALDDIEKRQHDSQATALLAKAAQYQDPGALDADLKSGVFWDGFDMSKLNPNDIKTVMSRPGDILAYAKDKTSYNQVLKAVGDDDRFRALEPVVNQYRQLAQDDPTGAAAAKFRSEHPELRNMSSSDFNALLTGSLKAAENQFDHNKDVTTFDQSQTDRDTGLKASSLDGFLTGVVVPEDRLRYINSNRPALDEKYGSRAVDLILRQAAGDVAPAGGASSGGAGGSGTGIGAGGKNVYDVVLGDGQGAGGGNAYGFNPPKPVSQMSMGELFDYQRSVMVPATAAKGVGGGQGSSAAGAYQIVSKTLERAAPKVFGANWRQMAFTPENQDKLGEFLFNEAKASGTDLHQVWEGLPAGTSPKNLNWAEARHMITQAESGGTVLANPRGLQIAGNTANQAEISASPAIQIAREFQAAWQDNRSAREMAVELTGDKGKLKGENTDAVNKMITKIAHDYKLSPAVAAAVMVRARSGDEGGWNSFWDGWANPFSDGLTGNYGSIDELATTAADRKGLIDAVNSFDRRARSIQSNDQTQALVDSLVAQRNAVVQRAAQRGIRADTTLIDQQLKAALGNRDAAAINGAVIGATAPNAPPPPEPIARRPAPRANQAPLILANTANDQDPSNAPWAKKALAKIKAGNKRLTPEEFTAAIAASGKKSLLVR